MQTARKRTMAFATILWSLALVAPQVLAATSGPLVAADGDGRLPVVIRTGVDPAATVQAIEEMGGEVAYVYQTFGAVSAWVAAGEIDRVRSMTGVSAVGRQRHMRLAIAPLGLDRLSAAEPRGAAGQAAAAAIVPMPGATDFQTRTVPLAELQGRTRGASLRGDGDARISTYLGYDLITGAADVWDDVGMGEGVLVAVLDTGVFPDHPLYAGSVVGGMNLVPAEEEELIDVDGDEVADGLSFDWNAIQNHPHGSMVSGLIVGHAEITVPEDNPFVQSLLVHSPETVTLGDDGAIISLFGTAPGASIYGVKVFPYDGGSAPDARVAEAIDRLVQMKLAGELDVDVINMSLSGPVLCDDCNVMTDALRAAQDAGIVVVAAAGNDGPALRSVGTPGASQYTIAAGAAVDPLHTRVAFEVFFGGQPGVGNVVFPYDNLLVANFSGRGLTGHQLVKPDILATGFLNYSSTTLDLDEDGLPDTPIFGIASGTSFAAPTVAGAAALLVATARNEGLSGSPEHITNALTRTATMEPGLADLGQLHTGHGFVRLPEAIEQMRRGRVWHGAADSERNVNQTRLSLSRPHAAGSSPRLRPGESFDFMIQVPPSTTKLVFTFTGLSLSEQQNPILGDEMVASIHSAKRGGAGDYLFVDVLEVGHEIVYENPEPGAMRVTMLGNLANWGTVSGSFEVQAYEERLVADMWLGGRVGHSGVDEHVIQVPEGVLAMGVLCSWPHDWRKFPTYDIDLVLTHGDREESIATIDVPELGLVMAPEAGDWTIRVMDLGTVTGHQEWYRLGIKFFDALPGLNKSDAMASLSGLDPNAAAATTLVDRAGEMPTLAAEPNPFNPATDVRFTVDRAGAVSVKVFDVTGRQVRTLADGVFDAGSHVVRWDGRTAGGGRAPSGVYFLEMDVDGQTFHRKLTLME